MNEVTNILLKHFPDTSWHIEKASEGLSDQAFIADNGTKKVFIKLGGTSPALKRLSVLRIAPEVLFHSELDSTPYIIQEFIDGTYPDIIWFANHLETFATFIQTYQLDNILKSLLTANEQTYQEHIKNELEALDAELRDSHGYSFHTGEVTDAVHSLNESGKLLRESSLAPTHADPNPRNFLLTSDGLKMVDWDDIMLSDPMKDVSLILWWYVPHDKWAEFFLYYRSDLDEEKIYWWIARSTLGIAAWFDKRGDEENAEFFVEDFLRAIRKEDNSQIFFSTK